MGWCIYLAKIMNHAEYNVSIPDYRFLVYMGRLFSKYYGSSGRRIVLALA